MSPPQFAPVQQRIYDALKDGVAHAAEDLRACLSDELGPIHNVRVQVSQMRKMLRIMDSDIISLEIRGVSFYQLVHIPHLPESVRKALASSV